MTPHQDHKLSGQTLPYGYTLYTFESLQSTMDKASELAEKGYPHGTLVMAEKQTAGRGRRGSSWIALEGNLSLSLLMRPECAVHEMYRLSFLLCIAVGHALLPFLPRAAQLGYKWPNDVIVNNKKVGGCLLEVCNTSHLKNDVMNGVTNDAMVIGGVGLNVQNAPQDMPFPATSLCTEGIIIDRATFLSLFCAELFELLTVLRSEGFESIKRLWFARMWGIGRKVRVQQSGEWISGIVRGIDEEGGLCIEGRLFQKHCVKAADVIFECAVYGNK